VEGIEAEGVLQKKFNLNQIIYKPAPYPNIPAYSSMYRQGAGGWITGGLLGFI